MDPETWRLSKEDLPVAEAILRLGNVDLEAPDIIRALAAVGPFASPPGATELGSYSDTESSA